MNCRRWCVVVALLLAGCNRAPQSKEAVQAGIMEHLSKNSGLDVSQMTIDVSDIRFSGDQAYATVSFKPKSSPSDGMSMNYTLERNGRKWIVQKRADGAGHGAPSPGPMPPGHPPVGASPNPAK